MKRLLASGFQTPVIHILLWTCLFVLTFISEDMFLSSVHVEPNRVSVPAGETAAHFLSRSGMKRQRETIWGRQRFRSFSDPEPVCVSNTCVTSFGRTAGHPQCVFWNWALIPFRRRSGYPCAKAECQEGKRAHFQRHKRVTETILGLWLINKKLSFLVKLQTMDGFTRICSCADAEYWSTPLAIPWPFSSNVSWI